MAVRSSQKNTAAAVIAFLTFGLVIWQARLTDLTGMTRSCGEWNCQDQADRPPMVPQIRRVVHESEAGPRRPSFGQARGERDLTIIFLAVPKTGSRSLSNTFNVLFTHSMHYNYSIVPREMRTSSDILTSYLMEFREPAFLRGHFPFVELPKRYAYISVIRDPLERFISGFNFVKYGDGQIDTSKIRKAGDPEFELPIDECVDVGIGFCDVHNISTFTISFFCGYDPRCKIADEWTYHRAIKTVEERFMLVGLTEELNTTMVLLEHLLPNMAEGLSQVYTEKQKEKRHIYLTGTKEQPSQRTREKLIQMMSWEYSFYEYVKSKFTRLKEQILSPEND